MEGTTIEVQYATSPDHKNSITRQKHLILFPTRISLFFNTIPEHFDAPVPSVSRDDNLLRENICTSSFLWNHNMYVLLTIFEISAPICDVLLSHYAIMLTPLTAGGEFIWYKLFAYQSRTTLRSSRD